MMDTPHVIGLVVIYTFLVAAAVSFVDVSGVVVFGVAAAWFTVGRMVGRSGKPITKWGRQP